MDMKKIGKLVHTVDIKLKRNIDRLALEYDLTSVQFIAMEWIHQNCGERDVFQKDLENELDVRRSTVSNVLRLLDNKGYVRRESVFSDARLKKLVLTPAGLKIFKEFEARLAKAEAEDFQVFTAEETETLLSLLERLSAAIH